MINKFNNSKIKKIGIINRLLNLFYHTPKSKNIIDLQDVRNILIIDPSAIGDIVMLIPFLSVIKKNMPFAKITLVCEKWAYTILENEKIVDSYVFMKKESFNFPLLHQRDRKIVKEKTKELSKIRFDLAIEPRGDLRYIYFLHLCNAVRKVSYNYTGGECFLTDVIQPCSSVEHLVDDKMYLLHRLGFKFDEYDKIPRMKMNPADEILSGFQGCEDKIRIGIHPGASLKIKQWKYYCDLVRKIAVEQKFALFIFEGPGEHDVAEPVFKEAKALNKNVWLIKTELKKYIEILSVCDCIICNDSGAGHIAAAFRKIVIVIFGPVLPELARPYTDDGVFAISHNIDCKPCISSSCIHNCECINSISVDEVYTVFSQNIVKINR